MLKNYGGSRVRRKAIASFVLAALFLMAAFQPSIFCGVARGASIHDVAVTNATSSKSFVGQGYSVEITVTAADLGDYPETFGVVVYANTTLVGSHTVDAIFSGMSTLLSFTWNTVGFAFGNYTVRAYAGFVSGETNTSDNSRACWVFVSMVGDIIGQGGCPDGKVNIIDVSYVARRFHASAGDPLWDPNADINGDGDVDIIDIAVLARRLGGNRVVHQFEHVVVDDTTYASACMHAVGDVDGDGFSDIVAARDSSGLAWYKYPTWNKYSIQSFNWRADDIEAVDVNSDDSLDVLGVEGDDGMVFWFENPRSGGNPVSGMWVSHYIGTSGAYVKDLEIADFNGDGKLDVVTRTETATSIFMQNSPTSWTEIKTLDTPPCDGLAVGDIDGDGISDIVLNGYWYDVPSDLVNDVWTQYDIDSKWFSQNTGDWSDNNAKVAVADINRDGRLDVLISQSEKPNYPVSWYESSNPKGGGWIEHVIGYVDYCHTLKVGDMDEDGNLDVVVGKFERDDGSIPAPFFVKMFYNKGNGLSWEEFLVDDVSIYTGVIGDIGNDGDLDIVGSRSHWEGPLEVWINVGSGRLPLNQWTHIQVDNNIPARVDFPNGPAYFFGLAMGDMNGDRYKDIVAHNILLPSYTNSNPIAIDTGKESHLGTRVADMDGDGDLDIGSIGWNEYQYVRLWRNDAAIHQ